MPELVKSALRLEAMGAQLLIMSCNTAHYFYNDVIPYLDVPFMSMIEETVKYLKDSGVSKAAVLATDGTRDSKVYEKALLQAGIEVVYPSEKNQKLLMSLIYDYVKAGKPGIENLPVQELVDEVKAMGAQKMILGCTELPLILDEGFMTIAGKEVFIIDPTSALARRVVKMAQEAAAERGVL